MSDTMTADRPSANGTTVVVDAQSTVVSRAQLLKPDAIEALVHESLCQVERDEHGNLRKLAPDWRGYSKNVRRYGDRVPLVRAAAEDLAVEAENIRNLRLDLDDADDDESAEDGEGEDDLGV